MDGDTPGDNRAEWRSPSVDFSAYLRRHANPEDFVVVKMDVEGGEWTLIDHLTATGGIHNID